MNSSLTTPDPKHPGLMALAVAGLLAHGLSVSAPCWQSVCLIRALGPPPRRSPAPKASLLCPNHRKFHRQDRPRTTSRRSSPPIQYRVTCEAGTEPPFRNAYWNNHKPGIYVDIISGKPLCLARLDKFDSGTGWPSFTKPLVQAERQVEHTDSDPWHGPRRRSKLEGQRRASRPRLRRRPGSHRRPALSA